jgi:hypothetical protein
VAIETEIATAANSAIIGRAEGALAERDFAPWLREGLRHAPGGEAREPRGTYRAKPRGARRTAAGARRGR